MQSSKKDDPQTIESLTQAIKSLSSQADKKAELAIAYHDRGSVHYYLGNYELAINDCNDTIQLEPQCVQAHYNRGTNYCKQGKHPQAIKDFSVAFKDPQLVSHFKRTTPPQADCKQPSEDMIRSLTQPDVWSVPYFNVFSRDLYKIKNLTLKAIKELPDSKLKQEALCQSLIEATVLGKLFYTPRRLGTPSIEKGFLREVAKALQEELTAPDAKITLSKATKKALSEDVKLQRALLLQENFLALSGKLMKAIYSEEEVAESKSAATIAMPEPSAPPVPSVSQPQPLNASLLEVERVEGEVVEEPGAASLQVEGVKGVVEGSGTVNVVSSKENQASQCIREMQQSPIFGASASESQAEVNKEKQTKKQPESESVALVC